MEQNTYHEIPLVVSVLFVKIDHIAIEGPDEREVQGGIKRGSALHGGIFSHSDVGIDWGQDNPRGICPFLNKGVKLYNLKQHESSHYMIH